MKNVTKNNSEKLPDHQRNRIDGLLLAIGIEDKTKRHEIVGKLTPQQLSALDIIRARDIAPSHILALDVIGKHNLTREQINDLDKTIYRSSWTFEQEQLGLWLRSMGVEREGINKIVNSNSEIRSETVKLLSSVFAPNSLSSLPKIFDLVNLVRDRHNNGEGVSAWMGFGVSANKPPLPQPLAPVRDLISLDDWIRLQSFLHEPAKVLAVVDDYLAPTHNGISASEVKAHAREKKAMIQAFNTLYNGNIHTATISELIEHYGYRWTNMEKVVRKLVDKNTGFIARLRDAIPDEFRPSDPIGYGIGEVVLTLLLAEDGYYMKFGHKGESNYDSVSDGISRSKLPKLSKDGQQLTEEVTFKRSVNVDGKKVTIDEVKVVPSTYSTYVFGIHFQNPPTFAPLVDSGEEHEWIPRSVSYRIAGHEDEILTLHNNSEDICRLISASQGNDAPKLFWNTILERLGGRMYDGDLAKGLSKLVRGLKTETENQINK